MKVRVHASPVGTIATLSARNNSINSLLTSVLANGACGTPEVYSDDACWRFVGSVVKGTGACVTSGVVSIGVVRGTSTSGPQNSRRRPSKPSFNVSSNPACMDARISPRSVPDVDGDVGMVG